MQQIADIQNSSLWTQVYSASQTAQITSAGTMIPIGEIIVPTTVSSQIITVYANSAGAKPSWNSMGWLSKYVSTGVLVGGNQDTKVDFSRRILKNQPLLVEFLDFNENYGLRFRPHKWLPDVSLQVWTFTGSITTDTDEQLESARVDILRIEEEIKLITRQVYTVTIQ